MAASAPHAVQSLPQILLWLVPLQLDGFPVFGGVLGKAKAPDALFTGAKVSLEA